MAIKGTLTEKGKEKAQDALVKEFTKFKLEDTDGNIYYDGDVSSVYYDDNGDLSAEIHIDQDTDLRNTNKYIRVYNEDGDEMCNVETDPIEFSYGVGGNILIKFDFQSIPGDIEFINGDFVTNGTFNDFYNYTKETLDDHKNKIDTNADNISKNSDNISKNYDSIQTNAGDISNLKDRVSDDEDKIKTNSDNITTNSDNIKTNSNDISDLQDKVKTNSDNIKTEPA
jgi:methyl-accepting chemotaxis protein